ncbi:AbrB family transcriptional regulator, stage V sporulation protein T [Halobacillus alkaliphilus]|uniref:Stage V sporulation protein T n=2 Tax=Halobacillus TaxID=45667 RepID=I0JH37_HALH3|nr:MULTISPECIES: stage V sporulation protein T [Halobacillus]ASF37680.1 stage V sporulation protein T [Halobacillus halophilus]CCG43455.1 stage V sporulation protein T [Halobacillus halophilus DSM 2266]SFG37005.1 AbrB family transcriptional regulator, stage V sporulation protein T [Halobacillus alkaliphilus]
MKATGIVRRIDDLGRVVIPKEIRRTLRIREGDPLEIFVDREGEVILKKYSPISELGDFAKEYAEALSEALEVPVMICDRDEYIAVAGVTKKDYLNRSIGSKIEQVMDTRTMSYEKHPAPIEFTRGQEEDVISYIIHPIIAQGDPIGCVAAFNKEGSPIEEGSNKAVQIAANFLAKQME